MRKRISGADDSEAMAYRLIAADSYASKIVPKFLGLVELDGESFIELQDLLHGFNDPAIMDIKMGRRTFLESEVTKSEVRNDLYEKMIAVAADEPTEDEHKQQAVTKLRYMLFREQMSSTNSKGFRIEALRMKGSAPITDLKKIKTDDAVYETVYRFLCNKRNLNQELLNRLKRIRTYIEKSNFFQSHEIIGSSILIIYDEDNVGAWLIDFAKSRPLENMEIDHRREWTQGNHEEGLLFGLDELIKVFEKVCSEKSNNMKSKAMKSNQQRRNFFSRVFK